MGVSAWLPVFQKCVFRLKFVQNVDASYMRRKTAQRPPLPPISGGIDELRAAASYSRQEQKRVRFTLNNPDDSPVAKNILKDACIDCQVIVTLVLRPQPIEGEDDEVLDPFFADASFDEIKEAASMEPVPTTPAMPQKPKKRTAATRAYMKWYYLEHREKFREYYRKRRERLIKQKRDLQGGGSVASAQRCQAATRQPGISGQGT